MTRVDIHLNERPNVDIYGLQQQLELLDEFKQDGNVPSRRHILGSKIFKEQLLETFGKIIFFKKNLKFFFEKKYFFRKSHNAEKLKRRPFRLIKRFYKPKTSKKCN